MFLRILLVGMVSGLGLELPVRSQIAGAEKPRCRWCEGRAADAEPASAPIEAVAAETGPAPMPNGDAAFVAEPAPEPMPAEVFAEAEPVPAEVPAEADPDATFGAILEAMVADFDADATLPAPAEPAIPQEVAVAVAPPAPEPELEPAEDLYPGLAYALNRDAEGLTIPPAEPPAVAPAAPEPDLAAVPAPARPDRLRTAVRLTGEAAMAWLSLLHTSPAVALEAEGSTLSR